MLLRALVLALVWPAHAGKSSGKSNGKSFRRSGAWVLSKEYMAQARCNQSGVPAIECAYKLDSRLATCLAQLFHGRSVTELGAGVGRYKRFVEGTGLAGECWPLFSPHPQQPHSGRPGPALALSRAWPRLSSRCVHGVRRPRRRGHADERARARARPHGGLAGVCITAHARHMHGTCTAHARHMHGTCTCTARAPAWRMHMLGGRRTCTAASARQALVRSDWALSLEVAEHIPIQFEQTLLRNWDRANSQGIVLSWSSMGSAQSAHGHVNPKRKSQVRLLLSPLGYVEDRNASAVLRRCATFLYLKRGVQVFRRDQTHTAPKP